MVDRLILIILDGVGVGALPDAAEYGDEGAATLPGVSRAVGGRLKLPVMQSLGLGNIVPLYGVPAADNPCSAYGRMMMCSPGKDTTTGHWEIAGVVLQNPFPVYPAGFPAEIIRAFNEFTGRGILGNKPASGTEIIHELGEEHLRTRDPIVYTSADSVFQIAAHEDIVPVEQLYSWCAAAREILTGEHGVSRVIARPFVGSPGAFVRTARRRDFSLPPPENTMLDILSSAGLETCVIGKISDIFTGRGITRHIPAYAGNESVEEGIWQALNEVDNGLIWANFNDFDTLYGHRNDPAGFARALEKFDLFLGRLLTYLAAKEPLLQQTSRNKNGIVKTDSLPLWTEKLLSGTVISLPARYYSALGDLVIITADHGCDPTWPGTDHTREYVPLLIISPDGFISPAENKNNYWSASGYRAGHKTEEQGYNFGTRQTMADLGCSILHWLSAGGSG